MLDMVHTGGESPQNRLRDIQICKITLALVYMLCYLSTTWLQLQIRGINPR